MATTGRARRTPPASAPDTAPDTAGDEARRPDLAAMMVPLARALVAAEVPVLRRHGLSMWAYAVLLGLGDQPTRTQAALAQAIGADKTRIIGVLDDLAERALIRRHPDPADRRVRLLSVTARGRRLREAVRADIRAGEERLLARLPAADRRGFLRALRALAVLSATDIVDATAPPGQPLGRR